jgi:RNA polymerase sigma factor (sigma-70 family)
MSVAGIAAEANTTDEQLVAAVRRGDDRAFEQIYERYQRRIAAYVYGMVNDYGRAEDLTQEIFVSAVRRIRATERPIAFKPWVYEIARNACIDHFRRARRTDEVSFDADEGIGALEAARLTTGHTPDAAVDTKQQLDDLCGAFGGLSDAHHEILVMRELEGLSYREIGERLGLSRPSVESTLFRARRRLSEEYQELVSGERCRRVSEMLASGVESLGTRDERRLARHVAHCQPCRRQAYAAGVDTATLTRHRVRESVRRAAAFLPLPAFLRIRADHVQTAAAFSEPAAGWTKAVAAAAVLLAGGAGVAAHHSTPAPGGTHHAVPVVEHAAPVSSLKHRAPSQKARASQARSGGHVNGAGRTGNGTSGAGRARLPHQATGAVAAPKLPTGSADAPSSAKAKAPESGAPTVPQAPIDPPAQDSTVTEAVHQAENALTRADGDVGKTVTDVADSLGVGN